MEKLKAAINNLPMTNVEKNNFVNAIKEIKDSGGEGGNVEYYRIDHDKNDMSEADFSYFCAFSSLGHIIKPLTQTDILNIICSVSMADRIGLDPSLNDIFYIAYNKNIITLIDHNNSDNPVLLDINKEDTFYEACDKLIDALYTDKTVPVMQSKIREIFIPCTEEEFYSAE